jgi:hypothetical protein
VSTSAQWLPRAEDNNGRGDLLRRAFEERLERRDEAGSLVERLERLRIAELERRDALAALADLPLETRGLLAGVLALPAGAQAALAALL